MRRYESYARNLCSLARCRSIINVESHGRLLIHPTWKSKTAHPVVRHWRLLSQPKIHHNPNTPNLTALEGCGKLSPIQCPNPHIHVPIYIMVSSLVQGRADGSDDDDHGFSPLKMVTTAQYVTLSFPSTRKIKYRRGRLPAAQWKQLPVVLSLYP